MELFDQSARGPAADDQDVRDKRRQNGSKWTERKAAEGLLEFGVTSDESAL